MLPMVICSLNSCFPGSPWAVIPSVFHFGVDGISILMVLLTTFLTPLAILSTWKAVAEKVKGFMAFFLLLEVGMLGVFLSLDMVLFYIFWEFTLIPMYFLIGLWGGERRVYAAVKFFLYTFAGSILMLAGILWIGLQYGSVLTFPSFQARVSSRYCPVVALWCFRLGICHQSAHVPAALLAAGCPH